MTRKEAWAFLKRLHETGALSVPPSDLRAAVEDATNTDVPGGQAS